MTTIRLNISLLNSLFIGLLIIVLGRRECLCFLFQDSMLNFASYFNTMKLPIFLDYNSTTPVDERVLKEMLPYFSEKFGNASSRTHAYGWEAAAAIDQASEQTAHLIHAETEEITFTSGATEAINLALKGAFESYRSRGNHIITVSTEHKAVLDTCRLLERAGAMVTYLEVDREGIIDLDELKKSFTDKTIVVCVMTANNETGVLQPIQQVASVAHEHGVIMMSDTTQACGKIKVDVNEDGIDLLCLSAHKLYGPKGIGALYMRRKNPRVRISAQMHGGGHEKGLRSGTLNVTGIVGLGKACELAAKEMWDDAGRISVLRTRLEQMIADLGGIYINGSIRNRLPNTSNLAFEGIDSNELVRKLKDVAVATGSACTSALPEPSHVLSAMGLGKALAHASVRFSLGRFTTEEEVDFAVDCVKNAVNKLRKSI